MPHSGQKKIKEIGQTFCCNLKSACVKAIWDLFPQNERQVTKIHFQDMTRFKMVYYMSWLLPYLRSKTIFTLSNSFVFYWFLKCSMSHTSFSSLATCRSFCDNRSHMLLFKSKNKHIKKTFHCCRRHNLPFLSTIIPSTSLQLSTDIRALWSTDALVALWSFFRKGHFLTESTTHLLGIQYEYLLFTNSYQLLDFKRSCPYYFFWINK